VGDICECYSIQNPTDPLTIDCQKGIYFPIRIGGPIEHSLNIAVIPDCPNPGNNFIERNAENLIKYGWGDTTIIGDKAVFVNNVGWTNAVRSGRLYGIWKTDHFMNDMNGEVNFWASTNCAFVDKNPKIRSITPNAGDFNANNRPPYGEYFGGIDAVGVIIPSSASTRRCFSKSGGVEGVPTFCVVQGDNGTFMHELSHAAFQLKDEYCCDTAYDDAPNIFDTLTECQDASYYAGSANPCIEFCPSQHEYTQQPGDSLSNEFSCGSGWLKYDLPHCLMQDGNKFNPPYVYGDACKKHIVEDIFLPLSEGEHAGPK
jgi:hypothetical protein